MDIEKLIEQLKKSADFEDYPIVASFAAIIEKKYLREAATALSTLQAENKKLRADVVRLNDLLASYQNVLVPEMRSELDQVKRECDEAVQCIRGIAKSGRVWMCPYCVHAKDTTGGIAECELDVGVCMMPYSKFEWRGQKED